MQAVRRLSASARRGQELGLTLEDPYSEGVLRVCFATSVGMLAVLQLQRMLLILGTVITGGLRTMSARAAPDRHFFNEGDGADSKETCESTSSHRRCA